MVRPATVTPVPPPGSRTLHRYGRTTVGTSSTTLANHIAENALQDWPTGGIATVKSDEGAADAGRVIECIGVNDEYVERSERVTLDENGRAGGGTWFDMYRLLDRSDDVASAVGRIVADIDGTVTCAIEVGRGQSQCARQWIPAGFTGFLQKVHMDFDRNLDDASLWVWDVDGTWRALTNLLAGSGDNKGNNIDQDYTSITSGGIAIQGPSRIEFRAEANSGSGDVVVEYTLLLVPNEQVERIRTG